MRSLAYSLLAAAVLPVLLSASCQKNTASPCDGTIVCTQLFAMVQTEVKDDNGATIRFDDVYTLRQSNQEIIRPEQNAAEEGKYVVLNDIYQKTLAQQTDTFYFTAFKNGEKLVEEPFVISADCCHIKKESGKDVIVLGE